MTEPERIAEIAARLKLHRSWRDSHGELNDAPNQAADALAQQAARIAVMEGALRNLLAIGPDHSDWCAIGPLYNCTCDLHPARQEARAALQSGERTDG